MSMGWVTKLGALVLCSIFLRAGAGDYSPEIHFCDRYLSDPRGCELKANGKFGHKDGDVKCEPKNLMVQYHPTALMRKTRIKNDFVTRGILDHVASGRFAKDDFFTLIYGPTVSDTGNSHAEVYIGNMHDTCKQLVGMINKKIDEGVITKPARCSTSNSFDISEILNQSSNLKLSPFTSASALKTVLKSLYIIRKDTYAKCDSKKPDSNCNSGTHNCDDDHIFEQLQFKDLLEYLNDHTGKDISELVPRLSPININVNGATQSLARKIFSRNSNAKKYMLLFYDPVGDSISYSRLSPPGRCDIDDICYKNGEADKILSRWNAKHSTFLANYPDILEVKSVWQEDYADGYLRIPKIESHKINWTSSNPNELKGVNKFMSINLSRSAVEVSDPKTDKMDLIYYLMELDPEYFAAYGITDSKQPIFTQKKYYSKLYGLSEKMPINDGGLNCYSPAATAEAVYGTKNFFNQDAEGASKLNDLFNVIPANKNQTGTLRMLNQHEIDKLSRLCSIPLEEDCTSFSCQLWKLSKPEWYLDYVKNNKDLTLDSLRISGLNAVASTIEYYPSDNEVQSLTKLGYNSDIKPVAQSKLSKWASTRILFAISDLSTEANQRRFQLINAQKFEEIFNGKRFKPEEFLYTECRNLIDGGIPRADPGQSRLGIEGCALNMEGLLAIEKEYIIYLHEDQTKNKE